MGPVMTAMLLIIAAMVLAFLEILTPSFGLLAISAIGSLAAAIWVAFSHAPWLGWTVLVSSTVLAPAYMTLLVRFLPHTPIGKRMFLAKAPDGTGQGTPDAEMFDKMIGRTGVAATLLRPGGMVLIGGDRLPARAETGMIEKDTPVKVVGADSMNVIVRKADTDA